MEKGKKVTKKRTKNEELKTVGITLYTSDIKRFEELKTKIPQKSLSNFVRTAIDYYLNNTESIKKNSILKSPNSELLGQLEKLLPQESKQTEQRFIAIESKINEIFNQLQKINAFNEELDKEKFDKVKKTVNGLGGKY